MVHFVVFFFCQLVQKFSKCPAVIEAEKGGKLQMFEGCVSGEYTELVKSSYSFRRGGGGWWLLL